MEHGIWSTNDKRSKMIGRDGLSPLHKARIIDLFKTYLHPPSWVMSNIDLILVDYQDTGSRYSTYTATLSKIFDNKISTGPENRANQATKVNGFSSLLSGLTKT